MLRVRREELGHSRAGPQWLISPSAYTKQATRTGDNEIARLNKGLLNTNHWHSGDVLILQLKMRVLNNSSKDTEGPRNQSRLKGHGSMVPRD